MTDRGAKTFRNNCRCLSACTAIVYDAEVDRSKFDWKAFLTSNDVRLDNFEEWAIFHGIEVFSRFCTVLFVIVFQNISAFNHRNWSSISRINRCPLWNVLKHSQQLTSCPFVVVCLDYFWVFLCWVSSNSYITRRFTFIGRFARGKRQMLHSTEIKMNWTIWNFLWMICIKSIQLNIRKAMGLFKIWINLVHLQSAIKKQYDRSFWLFSIYFKNFFVNFRKTKLLFLVSLF